jgi:hypothetical protein
MLLGGIALVGNPFTVFIILYYTIFSPSSHEVLQEGSKFQMQQVFTEETACVNLHSM